MLSCKDASTIISQSLDRTLTLRERINLKSHLLICKYCRYFSQQLLTLRVAIKANVTSLENDNTIEMPPEAKKRITTLFDSVN